MKNLYMFFICFSTLMVVGCASIVSKSDYPVSFNSDPSGAKVIITDVKAGRVVYEGKTPCTITLKAKHGFFSSAKYSVSFKLPGYETQTISLEANLDGWYFGNILFGGLIGILIVDPATGAMWKLPDNISVTLQKTGGISMKYLDKELKIVLYDTVPQSLRAQLIRIN